MVKIFTILFILIAAPTYSQSTYTNPIIHADYSDPDAIRVGDDFYMISSSFNHIPGLPILHSRDLVHWELIGHALLKQPPFDLYSKVQHGNGVWAPSIRYHNNEFYIYYPDPDLGIYLIRAKNILGPWSEPLLVQEGKGLIDPCPLWDDNGRVYLVHAFAGSRAGIKSILVVKEMNKEGNKVISDAVLVYDGHEKDPTIEGPKFYKRNGYYYIFAPAGGVSTGWQVVLRSKHIYGPYERRIVMAQGKSEVNGPHQGAWVNTPTGEDWFLHFQDREAYGRIIHLQPMKWNNDWPVIGKDEDGDGIGEPVATFKSPSTKFSDNKYFIPASDEFNNDHLGLQWQWQANPELNWAFPDPTRGVVRLNSYWYTDSSLYNDPALLMQKFPAEEFTITTKMNFKARNETERTGLVVFGLDIASISLLNTKEGMKIIYTVCKNADKNNKETIVSEQKTKGGDIYFRVTVSEGARCIFSYSEDGNNFTVMKEEFVAKPGKWVGAKVGLFCTRNVKTNDGGYADIDWFRVTN